MKTKENPDTLVPLGNGLELNLEKLYLNILGEKCNTVDEARLIIFSCSFGTNINMSKIPCTTNAMHLPALRAASQAYIWKNAFYPNTTY